MDGESGLQLVQFFLDLENHVGELVHAGAAVPVHAAYIDIGEVVVGAGFAGGNAHLGRCRLVVELDPQAAEQFLGLVVGQTAVRQPFFVEGIEMLVNMAGVHGVPAVEFRYRPQMYEPVHLDGLPEIARSVGGHPAADGSNLFQFRLADGIGAGGGHLFRQRGVAFGQQDGGIAGDGHRFEFLLFVGGLGVMDIVQFRNPLCNPRLHVQETFAIHPAVHRGVAGGALFHEFREDAGAVGLLPFLRDVVEDALALRLALPVGNHLASVGIDVLLADVVGLKIPGIQHVKVFDAVAGEFREGRNRLGPGPALAHDQLVRPDIEGFLRADLIEVLCTEHGYRILAVILLIEGGLNEGALDGEGSRRLHALLAQAPDPRVHSRVILRMLDGEAHDWQAVGLYQYKDRHYSDSGILLMDLATLIMWSAIRSVFEESDRY